MRMKRSNLNDDSPYSEAIQDTKILYFNWLLNILGDYGRNYSILCNILHEIEFYWTVNNDDNRENDGKNLREMFEKTMSIAEIDIIPDALCGPCSVLEMMIALSSRIEADITYDPDEPDRTVMWFKTMVSNLGLDDCCDENFNFDNHLEDKIYKKINKMLDRKYDFYGNGGLWPLKFTKIDQRKVEIWYQMCSYLEENYPDLY